MKKLKKGIDKHISETEGHVERLEECFKALGKKAQAKKCDAMQGLLDEGKSIMEETETRSSKRRWDHCSSTKS